MDENEQRREELKATGLVSLAIVAALVGGALMSCAAPAHAAPVNDKVLHAAGSAALAVGAAELLRRGHGPAACTDNQKLCAFGAVMAIGLTKELLPAPYNSGFSMRDMAANAVGAGLGLYAHGFIVSRNRITYFKEF
jgi:hypothetical protein